MILVSVQAEHDLPEPIAAGNIAGFLPKHLVSAAAIRRILAEETR